jgi:hypothetical protein
MGGSAILISPFDRKRLLLQVDPARKFGENARLA